MFDPHRLHELAQSGTRAAVCTVVGTEGSTPRKTGTSMVVIDDGSDVGAIEGTIGGGAVEHEVRRCALEVVASGQARLVVIPLTTQLGMCCGGTMSIFIEPLQTRPTLILFGAGHTGLALAALAHGAGFDVTVADPRAELLTRERFPSATALVDDYHRSDFANLPFSTGAFVVVATHDHQVDQQLVEEALSRPFRYLALVGSKRKALLTRERCANKGIDAALLDQLRCPAGLDIGAETPEEIALSIVAEMVQVRRAALGVVRRSRGARVPRAG